MSRNVIFPYNPKLRQRARELRKNSTLGEILLWNQIKCRKLGVQFHRQVPIHEYIVDFYCHELQLVIEVDGCSHSNPAQYSKDLKRDYQLSQLGIHVLRIDDIDVKKYMNSVMLHVSQKVDTLRHPLTRGCHLPQGRTNTKHL
ncbi:MAG: DUF559 domain-containing protein [Balneolaceae bacterium]|nr:DUF559 domain-containing protein [Balneolaceae bacterium]